VQVCRCSVVIVFFTNSGELSGIPRLQKYNKYTSPVPRLTSEAEGVKLARA